MTEIKMKAHGNSLVGKVFKWHDYWAWTLKLNRRFMDEGAGDYPSHDEALIGLLTRIREWSKNVGAE